MKYYGFKNLYDIIPINAGTFHILFGAIYLERRIATIYA